MRRAYTEEDKGAALAALDATGNVAGTARVLQIPRTTLSEWSAGRGVSSEVAANRERFRRDLSDKFGEVAWACLGAVTPEKLASAGLKDILIAAGIATEKMKLLAEGQPADSELDPRELAGRVFEKVFAAAREHDPEVTRELIVARIIEKRPQYRPFLAHLLPEAEPFLS